MDPLYLLNKNIISPKLIFYHVMQTKKILD